MEAPKTRVARHVPTRTCVGCRERAEAPSLVRLRSSSGRIFVDRPGAATGGRGAWLHPRVSCIEQALRARAFGRAFRGAAEPGDRKDFIAAVLGH